jgi:hypothetical protein
MVDRRSCQGRRRAAPLAANADRYVVLMIGITALLDGKLGREAARDGNSQHVLEGLVRGFDLGGAGQHAAGARCERVLFEQGIAPAQPTRAS